MSGESIDFISVIIDLNPYIWSASKLSLEQTINHILIFVNSHVSLNYNNQVAVFYSHPNSTDFLFPKHSESLDKKLEARNKPGNAYKQFWHINEQILFNLKALASLDTEEEEFKPSLLSNTISMALTYINRIIRKYEPQTVNSRIIIVSVSPDIPSQYITIMNNIFCAQRLMIKMDICKLLNEDSVFLQQAAYLTSGVYVKVEYPERLIHYLMHSFLPNSSMRETLALRSGDQVDFRAACFCHKKIVDVGFVCSVCLSIFCTSSKNCPTCKTVFSD